MPKGRICSIRRQPACPCLPPPSSKSIPLVNRKTGRGAFPPVRLEVLRQGTAKTVRQTREQVERHSHPLTSGTKSFLVLGCRCTALSLQSQVESSTQPNLSLHPLCPHTGGVPSPLPLAREGGKAPFPRIPHSTSSRCSLPVLALGHTCWHILNLDACCSLAAALICPLLIALSSWSPPMVRCVS